MFIDKWISVGQFCLLAIASSHNCPIFNRLKYLFFAINICNTKTIQKQKESKLCPVQPVRGAKDLEDLECLTVRSVVEKVPYKSAPAVVAKVLSVGFSLKHATAVVAREPKDR